MSSYAYTTDADLKQVVQCLSDEVELLHFTMITIVSADEEVSSSESSIGNEEVHLEDQVAEVSSTTDVDIRTGVEEVRVVETASVDSKLNFCELIFSCLKSCNRNSFSCHIHL